MPVLVVLTLLVLAASVVLTRTLKSRAEAVIATSLVFNAIIVIPVYLLGLMGWLNRLSLAAVVGGFSILVVGLSLGIDRGLGSKAGLLGLGKRFVVLVALPMVGIVRTWRKRSLLVVLAGVAWLAFPYFLLVAYLAPAWRDWDALWYHEPIVAFTIQNHGFAPIDLPGNLQGINGVHRLGEMTQLFFAIFAGRRLVDVANVVFMPLMAASMFAVARRFTKDTVAGVAWASAILVFPGFIRIAQSTMVDPQNAALTLAAAYWVTHPKMDARNAFYAILGLTLASGSKIWTVVPVAILAVVLLGRLIANGRAIGRLKAAGIIVGGTLAISAMEAATFLRNLILFKNPFWAMLSYDNPRLGIHWTGGAVNANDVGKAGGLNLGDPFPVLVEKALDPPFKHMGPGHTWQVNDYGFAYAWVVFPVIALVLVALFVTWFVSTIAVVFRIRARSPRDADTDAAMVLAITALVPIYLSPALHIPRYHVASIGMLIGCMCWAASRLKTARFVEDTAFVAGVGSILMAAWGPYTNTWTFLYSPKTIAAWMKTPYPRREVMDVALTPHVPISAVVPETGIVRDRDMKPGDILAFDGLDYAAVLWNSDYSNKVVWVGEAPDPFAEAERVGATWIYSRPGNALASKLVASGRWQLVGPLEAERFGNLYRRK